MAKSTPLGALYVTGKMEDTNWRDALFDEYDAPPGHHYQEGWNPLTMAKETGWPASSRGTVCGLRYTGPFFVDLLGGHGYAYFEGDEHGGNVNPAEHVRQDDAELEARRSAVQAWCFQAIARADLIFAWIDCIDCYGAIAEVGYARALGKTIWIAGPRRYDDLWFVYTMADRLHFTEGAWRK